MEATKKTKQNKRNPLLIGKIEKQGEELETDEFLPKYELEFGLPDIPVKPKLFRYVDTDPLSSENTLYKYEYSSIEMIQEQSGQSNQIYTDYNLGMRTNLVDRDIYKLPAGASADELKQQMSEKLKFVLSSKEVYDPFEGQKKARNAKKIIIPSKYRAHDKINTYGGKIEDPFKLNTMNQGEIETRVFTSQEHKNDILKRECAIKLINESFAKVKNIKVGMQKPDSHGSVKAMKVFDIIPSFQSMPRQVLHVLNEDQGAVEENIPVILNKQGQSQNAQIDSKIQMLKKAYKSNNGQLLMHFQDQSDGDKKFALYRYDHEKEMPDEIAKLSLGKRVAQDRPEELNQTLQFEHVRNYCYSQIPNEAKDEFVIQIDRSKNVMKYQPIGAKLALQKKRKILNNQTQDDDMRKAQQDQTKFITMVPRSFTAGELKTIQKSFVKQDVSVKVIKDSNIFENRKDLDQVEKQKVQPLLQSMYSDRIKENKKIFKQRQINEYRLLHNIQDEPDEQMQDENSDQDLVKSDDYELVKRDSKNKQSKVIQESDDDKDEVKDAEGSESDLF